MQVAVAAPTKGPLSVVWTVKKVREEEVRPAAVTVKVILPEVVAPVAEAEKEVEVFKIYLAVAVDTNPMDQEPLAKKEKKDIPMVVLVDHRILGRKAVGDMAVVATVKKPAVAAVAIQVAVAAAPSTTVAEVVVTSMLDTR